MPEQKKKKLYAKLSFTFEKTDKKPEKGYVYFEIQSKTELFTANPDLVTLCNLCQRSEIPSVRTILTIKMQRPPALQIAIVKLKKTGAGGVIERKVVRLPACKTETTLETIGSAILEKKTLILGDATWEIEAVSFKRETIVVKPETL